MWWYRIAAIVLFVAINGCDGHTQVEGRVTDVAGNPIPEASVHFVELASDRAFAGKSEATTDEDGTFAVGITHPPSDTRFSLEVSKEGYETHTEELSSRARQLPRKITLQKEHD